jgi:tetratricopeptide (TPR) repeat protein
VVASLFLMCASGCGPQQTGGGPGVVAAESPTDDALQRHRFLGDQYLKSKQPLEAAREYQMALELDPENVELHKVLGYAFLEAEDYEKAIKTYQRYVELRPKDCESYAALGFAYLRYELTDQARVAYEKAVALCPEDPNAYTNMGSAYVQSGDGIEAIEAFRRAIELNPSDTLTYEKLAGLYFDRKLYPEAIATYEAILARPDHGKDAGWVSWASQRLAFMYRWGGAHAKAIPYYQKVLEVDPSNTSSVKGLAIAYDKSGDDASAIEWYQKLIQAEPDKPEIYYRLGELLNEVGRYSEAIIRVKQGQAHDTGCGAHAHCVLGTAYEKLKEYQKAKRSFQQAVNCNDPLFASYAAKEIDRQQKFLEIEQMKEKQKEQGY